MSDSREQSDWRSLGHHEVLAADFESAGAPWDAVFSHEFSEPVPDWLRAALPDTGWRELTVRDTGGLARDRLLFAAPKDGVWFTVLVKPQPGGPPVFMGDLSPYRLRPTQEIRRQGLALSWPDPLRVAVPDLNAVTVTLTNTSDEVWMPDPEDHSFVHCHVLVDDGQAPTGCAFSYGSSPGDWKLSLAPGESAQLSVKFSHGKPPAPGSYAIEAILATLNLRSPRGILEVVLESDERPRMRFSEAHYAELRMQEEYERGLEKLLGRDPAGS